MPTPGLEVVGREKPVTVAYLDDLEASLVVSTSRAFHSVRRAESLVAQLKVPMIPHSPGSNILWGEESSLNLNPRPFGTGQRISP